MARRLMLEGAKVLACIEVMPYSCGLNRNIVQCLNDYDIPLYLSHTIIEFKGDRRVEGAVVARVDENRQPIAGSEMIFDCDTIFRAITTLKRKNNPISGRALFILNEHRFSHL